MGFIPHPTIPLGHVRPTDLWLLLAAGALWELVTRALNISYKRKSASLRRQENTLAQLTFERNQKRKLGAGAFVEISKLERQVLAEEKNLQEIYESRKVSLAKVKKMLRNAGYAMSCIIFVVYYGIAIVEMEGSKVPADFLMDAEAASLAGVAWTKAFMFPISYMGMGMKMSRWGLEQPHSSVGALVVFWSSQVTSGKIIDGIEALTM
jgi:hypothetical protein